MGVIWTLLVEVREGTDNTAVDMTLLDEERRWQWRAHREIDRNQFDHLRNLITDCFALEPQLGPRAERMFNLATTMSGDLRLEEFLDSSRLDDDSYLVINTTATSIPWDLVLFREKHLASELAVVLNIPIVNEGFFKKIGYLGRSPRLLQRHHGKQKFLHIVANPSGNLRRTNEEKAELKAIVESTPDLVYHVLENPTVHDILDEFSKPGLRYLHYSGHIKSSLGLLVGTRRKPEVLKIVNIESRFPGTDQEVVFLNGCDSHLDQSDLEVLGPVSVANAFLNAGAGAVIAPRSKISDDEAVEAAVYIWQRFLRDNPPVSLGLAVRDYRRKSIEARRNDLAGYTYVLYGTSSINTHRAKYENQSERFFERLQEHPLIRQAAIEADGTIGPRHLFAVLTRGWELGRVFFSHFDQKYIVYLTELRKALGCQQIAPRTSPIPAIRFSSGMELMLNAILGVAGPEATPTAMDFVAAISTIGDPEIVGALQQLEVSGLDLKDICQTALLLGEDPVPQALFQPDGWAEKQFFLRGFYDPKQDSGNAADTDGMIDVWQIFTALARADGNLGRLIRCSGLERPPSGVWNVDSPLHWCFLTNSAQNTLMVAAREMTDEQAKCTSESHLVYALFDDEHLVWENLTDNARNWIGDRARWKDLVENILLERFRWSSD